MNILKKLIEAFFIKLSIIYIKFVYKTSKLTTNANYALVKNNNEEKYVIGFWHGDTYCCYPLLKNSGIYIITTKNRRGDIVAAICRHFGYIPIRVPDESTDGGFLFKIRSEINGSVKGSLAVALDGPLGPYHIPKKFIYLAALGSKRKLMVITLKVKRKIRLTNRWDKYIIPLPFNSIEAYFHDPIEIKKTDFETVQEKIIDVMKE